MADFDWTEEDPVIRSQAAIAIYGNPHGDVVIRQEGQYGPDEDMWVVIAPHNVEAVARALMAEAGLEWPEAAPQEQSKALTPAERKRRSRQRRKERDECHDDGHGERDMDRDTGAEGDPLARAMTMFKVAAE